MLRCRENRAATGCDREWAFYEILFTWLEPDSKANPIYRRSDLRSGGLTVVSRLLNWIDVRGRRLNTARLGDGPGISLVARLFQPTKDRSQLIIGRTVVAPFARAALLACAHGGSIDTG